MLKTHIAPAAAILSVIAFLAWLSLSHPNTPVVEAVPAVAEAAVAPAPLPQDGAGSADPCAVPLHWRLVDVDPRFGITPEAAIVIARRAADAWERAVGRPLFVEDSLGGLPIRLVYDQRQAGSIERKRLDASLAEVDDRLGAESRALDSRREAYEERRTLYEQQAADFERASALHADSVKAYNLGASSARDSDLRTAQQRLDRQHGDLLAVGADLEEQRISIRDDATDLNRRIDEHRSRVEQLTKSLAPTQVESGTYRELVERSGGRNVAVRRAIDVYEFDRPEELWLVLTHEMGHALGLGHAKAPGAVMSAAHLRTTNMVSALQPADLELLRTRCPQL